MKAKRRRLDAILQLNTKGWTSGQIAHALGCSASYVRDVLDSMGVPARVYASAAQALQELATEDPALHAEVVAIRAEWSQQKAHQVSHRKDDEKAA